MPESPTKGAGQPSAASSAFTCWANKMAASCSLSVALIPVGRFGHADEVAEAAVMLARNGYITGQTINVNGGWYMT